MSLVKLPPRVRNVAVIEEYGKALMDLQANSKPLITMLTMLAEENKSDAADVVETIAAFVKETPHKLPVMYLIDSIVKNIGHEYMRLFSSEIVPIFSHVFSSVGEDIRTKLHALRLTWTDVFPPSRMYHLDVTINAIDHAWPLRKKLAQSTPAQNVHINPRHIDSPNGTLSKLKNGIPVQDHLKEKKSSSSTLRENKKEEVSKPVDTESLSHGHKRKKKKPEAHLSQAASQAPGPANSSVSKTRDPRLAKMDKKASVPLDSRKLPTEPPPKAKVPLQKLQPEPIPKKSPNGSKSPKPKIRPVSMVTDSGPIKSFLGEEKTSRKNAKEVTKPYNRHKTSPPLEPIKAPVSENKKTEPKKKFQIPKKKTIKQYQEEKRQQHRSNQHVPESTPVVSAPVHIRSPLNLDKDILEPPDKKRRLTPPSQRSYQENDSNLPNLFGSSDIDLRGPSKKPTLGPPLPPLFVDNVETDSNRVEPSRTLEPPPKEPGRVLQRRTSFHSANTSSWQKFRENNPEFLEKDPPPPQEPPPPKKQLWVRGDGRRHIIDPRDSRPNSEGYNHAMENLKTQLDEKQISSQEYQKSMENIWKLSEEEQIRKVQNQRAPKPQWQQRGKNNWRKGNDHPQIHNKGMAPHGEWSQDSRKQSKDLSPPPKPHQPEQDAVEVPLASEADLLAVDKYSITHQIKIDNILRDMRIYGDKTVVLMEDCDPHLLNYQQATCDVVVDEGVYVFHLPTNDSYRQFTIYDELHQLKIGSPGQEIFIDGVGYQCFFGGEPIHVNIAGQKRSIKLVGAAPEVIVDPSRNTEFLLGKIPLIINAKKVLPIYLDPRPQKFSINSHTHFILKFVDSFKAISINGVRVSVGFGKLPLWFRMGEVSIFLRFGMLPSSITPGTTTVVGMDADGKDLLPVYPMDTTVRPLSPPPATSPITEEKSPEPVVSQAGIFNVPTAGIDENSIPGLAPVTPEVDSGPVDLNSLLQSLMQHGVISSSDPAPAAPSEQKSAENSDEEGSIEEPSLEPSTMFNSENLKKPCPHIVRRVYRGMQCPSCSMRFLSENGPNYSKHLDWHFRQNKKQQESLTKPNTRKLFLPMDQWYHYEEVEDESTRELSVFEKEDCNQADNENQDLDLNFPCVPASRDDADHLKSCPQCHEKFDQIYDEEEEGYCYKNTIHEDGFNYHPNCYNDFLKIRERAKEMEIRKKVAQELKEAEMQRNRELQLQREAEKEAEAQREKELKLQQEREAELQRLKEIQHEKEVQLQREKDAEILRLEQESELTRLREAELQKESEQESEMARLREAESKKESEQQAESTRLRDAESQKESEQQPESTRLRDAESQKETEQEPESTRLRQAESQKESGDESELTRLQEAELQKESHQNPDHQTDLELNGNDDRVNSNPSPTLIKEPLKRERPSISSEEPLPPNSPLSKITEDEAQTEPTDKSLEPSSELESNMNPEYFDESEDELPYQKVQVGDEPIEESEVEMYVPPDFQIPCNLIKREVVTPEIEETEEPEIVEPVSEVEEVDEIEVIEEPTPVGASLLTSLDGNVLNADPIVPLQQPAPVIKVNFSKSSNIAPSNPSKNKIPNGIREKSPVEPTEFIPPPFKFDPEIRPAFSGVELKQMPVHKDVVEESSLCSIM